MNDVSDSLFEWMIKHPESARYEEVQENQNLPGAADEVSHDGG